MLKVLKNFRNAYRRGAMRHPVGVESFQTSLLMGTGDILAQNVLESDPYDVVRTVRFATIGAFMGPALVVWFKILDKIVGKASYAVPKKVFLDQLIFAPSWLLLVQTTVKLSEGKSVEEVKKILRETYPGILLAKYKIWPAAQLINFTFVPKEYRVRFAQIVALFWNIYASYKIHADTPSD